MSGREHGISFSDPLHSSTQQVLTLANRGKRRLCLADRAAEPSRGFLRFAANAEPIPVEADRYRMRSFGQKHANTAPVSDAAPLRELGAASPVQAMAAQPVARHDIRHVPIVAAAAGSAKPANLEYAPARATHNRPDARPGSPGYGPPRQALMRPAARLGSPPASYSNAPAAALTPSMPNRTGLPTALKAGVEALSGFAMDRVRVHRNSPRPAQLQAHGFASGSDIHLAPGQERHLPHEAWHVAQQARDRVPPTAQLTGNVDINDDPGLEREADVMGARAAAFTGSSMAAPDPVRAPDSAAAPVFQLKPVLARATGISHLVTMQQGGLTAGNFADNEGPEIKQPDELEIDDERIHVSRRGPNQEVNAGRDAQGPAQYPWYLVTMVNGMPVAPDTFVRADAIVVGTATPKMTPEQVAQLDLPIGQYIESQKAYQDKLAEDHVPKTTYRSVGFEFEFAAHDQELAAHIDLAQSENFSKLFKLPFLLETDSGSVLEIGFPPFVFANRPDGSPNTAAISLIYQTVQNRIRNIGDKPGETLDQVILALQAAGFGSGWELIGKGQIYHDMLKTGNKSESEKLKERGIYSQMNISLTARESAEAMRLFEPRTDKNIVESSYKDLRDQLHGGSEAAAKIHIAKCYANALASLDILQESTTPLSKGWDVASTVKELLGVWVKDTPANILRGLRVDPQDLETAQDWVIKLIEAEIMKFDIDDFLFGKFKNFAGDGMRTLKDAISNRAIDPAAEVILARLPDTVRVAFGDAIEAMENPQEFGGVRGILAIFQSAVTPAEKTIIGHWRQEFDSLIQDVRKMTLRLKDEVRGLETIDRPKYGAETFGTGQGVRKDTYIKPISGGGLGEHLSVAEVRDDLAVKKFLNAK
jgi:hypothetical protein